MDHANAIETHATERYLLGELTAPEAEAFEEHYFDCMTCADDVRHGMQLMERGREVARENLAAAPLPVAPVIPLAPRRRRVGWLQLAAAATLVFGIMIPRFVQDDAPRPVFDQFFSASRAETAAVEIPAAYKLRPTFDLPPGYSRYEARIEDASGKTVGTPETYTPQSTRERQDLPPVELPAGGYVLVIEGVPADGNRPEIIEKHPFTVRR